MVKKEQWNNWIEKSKKQELTFEELLGVAYAATHIYGIGKVKMYTNDAINQSLYTQEFRLKVCPSNNKTPKVLKDGRKIVDSPIGYKELIVWVHFGNNIDWCGPELKWMYMDRSIRWDGERINGGVEAIEQLYEISIILKKEIKRIEEIEKKYQEEHGNLDGLIIEGYAVVE